MQINTLTSMTISVFIFNLFTDGTMLIGMFEVCVHSYGVYMVHKLQAVDTQACMMYRIGS
jgi:hypothetical protein